MVMVAKKRYPFKPDYVVAPGEVLQEHLDVRGLAVANFASQCETTESQIRRILSGDMPVTPELAIRFHSVLGVSARLWLNLDANYRQGLGSMKAG